jgi:hypothetical protein
MIELFELLSNLTLLNKKHWNKLCFQHFFLVTVSGKLANIRTATKGVAIGNSGIVGLRLGVVFVINLLVCGCWHD